jgi:hypothetical protein
VADNFGLKIGIEGEKEFKNAIREINQSFKVLGSEMNLVVSQFDKQDKSVEAVTARNKVLNKEIELQKEKIATLEKALANAASSFGETDRRTQSWQIQLNNAKAELNKMEPLMVWVDSLAKFPAYCSVFSKNICMAISAFSALVALFQAKSSPFARA